MCGLNGEHTPTIPGRHKIGVEFVARARTPAGALMFGVIHASPI